MTQALVRVLSVASAVVALIGQSGCPDDPLNELAPQIEIHPTGADLQICADKHVRDCSFAFGDVAIGQGRFLTFLIKNESPADLIISSITIEQDGDSLSFEGEVPTKVESAVGASGKSVTIAYVPRTATPLSNARVIIKSNGKNLQPDEDVVINLSGGGADLCRPEIQVTPGECNFGEVGVGATASCSLSVVNNGTCELGILGVNIDGPDDVFFGQGVFIIPTYVLPGTGTSITIGARPSSVALFTGDFVIESNDPVKPTVTIPLSVQGAEAPTAVGRVSRINGSANNAVDPSIEPLDDVRISADQSQPGRAGGSIVGWQWELIERPDQSSVQLSAPTSEETGFTFSSAAGTVFGVDVVGTFVVRLTVTDDTGAVSTNDARVTINSVPTEGFHVQITWDTSSNDIDLHVARGQPVDWCSDDDCYYGNCVYGDLEWDNVGGANSAGDPTLDIDDLSGYGPENTNIESPIDGSYTVGVDYFSGSGPVLINVRIFLGGALAWEGSQTVPNSSQGYIAARVDYASGVPTVIPIDTVQLWSCL